MAAAAVACLILFLAMAGHSSATYCICKEGLSDAALQKTLDYACGVGADCSPIQQNGACYNPNTLKDHCNYAVNSYYQRKNQAVGSCDFSGTANTSQATPNQSSGCVYPASPSTAGNTSTTPPTTPSTTKPPPPPSTTTTPSSNGTTTPTPPSVFGLGPTGSSTTGGTITTDSNASVNLHRNIHLFWSLITLTLLLSGPMFLRV